MILISAGVRSPGLVACGGELFVREEGAVDSPLLYGAYCAIVLFLVCTAGAMSGLTIGLMGLDLTQLRILEASGTESEKRYAAKIIPVVSRHHLCLVTLLLANAMAMEALPIFLDRLTSPFLAIIMSVTLVLLFGEIIPQALCSRYSLAIGAHLSGLVKFLMVAFFIVGFPISKLLDWLLGDEHATYLRRAQLKELVRMHGEKHALDEEESTIIMGALEMIEKKAEDAMTPIENAFMLEETTLLDPDTIKQVINTGHSRVPVYREDIQQVVGLLLTRRLVGVDGNAEKRVCQLPLVDMPLVHADTPLYDILNQFKSGKSHMAMVASVDSRDLIGIITLEDVFEELIQGEIVDETDVYVDHKKLQLAHMLRSLDAPLQRAIRTSIEMERRVSLDRRERGCSPRKEGRRSLSLNEFNQSNRARRAIPVSFDAA